jgi:hypothetical protein
MVCGVSQNAPQPRKGSRATRTSKDPVRHARAPEAATLGLAIQPALFKTRYGHTYRALYTLAGDTVHVIAVRGAGEHLATLDDVDLP